MWPGCTKSPGLDLAAASTRTALARSGALMPVVTPLAASTLTVKAVLKLSLFSATMCWSPSCVAR